jgi:hypothetical protein
MHCLNREALELVAGHGAEATDCGVKLLPGANAGRLAHTHCTFPDDGSCAHLPMNEATVHLC